MANSTAMALNIPPRNTDYDSINEKSTNEERRDVVYRRLIKEDVFNYMQYNKLFIGYAQESLFNARIEATNFVERKQPAGSQIMYRLTNKARLILDKLDNSYLKYLEAIKEY